MSISISVLYNMYKINETHNTFSPNLRNLPNLAA